MKARMLGATVKQVCGCRWKPDEMPRLKRGARALEQRRWRRDVNTDVPRETGQGA